MCKQSYHIIYLYSSFVTCPTLHSFYFHWFYQLKQSDPGDCNAIKEMQITTCFLFFLSVRICSDVWLSFQKTVSNANFKNLNIAHHEVSKPHAVPPMICLRTPSQMANIHCCPEV